MAGHGGLVLNTLDMVENDLCVGQITSGLHAPKKVDTAIGANLEHVEDEDFKRPYLLK